MDSEVTESRTTASNVWFTKKPLHIDKKDDRYEEYAQQLKENGFCDSETWNLGHCIIAFTLPRLKRFKETHNGYPMGMSEKQWSEILDKMIFAMEWALKEDAMTDDYEKLTQKEKKANWKKYEEGMKLFSDYLLHLWW